jgi:hypothetical protein
MSGSTGNKFIYAALAVTLLTIYAVMNNVISDQRLDLQNKNEDIALRDAEIEALQGEVVCLTEELEEMRQSWVPRSTVQMIDDVPTRSMKEFCYKMALAWKDMFPFLRKLDIALKEE